MDEINSQKDKKTTKSKSICELSVKDLKTHIDYVCLKEHLSPNPCQGGQMSKSRNKLKICIGKDRKSIDKLMKTAVNLLKNNNTLFQMADVSIE
jgi:hypothetical protein